MKQRTISGALDLIVWIAMAAIIVGALTFGIFAGYGVYAEQQKAELRRLVEDIDEVEAGFVAAREAEKSFMIELRGSRIEEHRRIVAEVAQTLDRTEEQLTALGLETEHQARIADLREHLTTYQAAFMEMAETHNRLGHTDDDGLKAEMRVAARDLEQRVRAIDDPEMLVRVLMMRRYEKDFLVRGDDSLLGDIDTQAGEFLDILAGLGIDEDTMIAIEDSLMAYQGSFFTIVGERMALPLLVEDMNATVAATEAPLRETVAAVQADVARIEARTMLVQGLLMAISAVAMLCSVVAFVISARRLCRRIGAPMEAVTHALTDLAAGKENITVPESDLGEITEICAAIGTFRDGLAERERLKAESEAQRLEQERLQIAHAEERSAAAERERQMLSERAEQEARAAAEIAEVVAACAAGDFSHRLSIEDKTGVFVKISQGINCIGDAAETGLTDAMQVMRALARGDLTQRMATDHPGIFRQIADAVNDTVGALDRIVGEILEGAAAIDSSSSEVASAAADISQRSERSAATLEETAAALEELSASVKASAGTAGEARTLASDAQERANSSQEIGTRTAEAIQRIAASSDKISKATSIIEDIAFQTNLLALNAGVEAARAGPAGAGFSVVASEVRALAQRSSEAAREINGLIEESVNEVQRGVGLVDANAEALTSVLEGIRAIVSRISQIADTSSEQSVSITELTSAMHSLDRTTQENVAILEETTAASSSLFDEARRLNAAVAHFTRLQAAGARAIAAE
ncbi:methyl-accepting chemotaxis protein [Phaeovulum vinaykumarii]|uniref:Methyl-accepting chemotaxis protein n=1 Tax=Phaeovulum vinaykumarii TaxID=407234 RepID=A0A1N7L7P8_9RHOB|nr:methyl-accepting chemotaxis protein [Phaeovulum vinaykumarii]SIS69813.1 methyl-accepting chemotaxis protein [Phaeovulum vinaykumarii]SOB99296.1 methyl-accepting chemotaxis protein [Phaeovulum vinaykumarii]